VETPTVRILIPAQAVVFDRTGGHLLPPRAEAAIVDARPEGGEYVFGVLGGRVYSVAADAAIPYERPAREHIAPAVAAVLSAEEAAEAAGREFTPAEAAAVYAAAQEGEGEEGDDLEDEFCAGCYRHHGDCRCD
jgi:hypothetical protein